MLLTPNNHKKFKKGDKHFINILLKQDIQAKQCTFYKEFILDIEPFTVRMENNFFEYAMEFSNNMFLAMEYKEETV